MRRREIEFSARLALVVLVIGALLVACDGSGPPGPGESTRADPSDRTSPEERASDTSAPAVPDGEAATIGLVIDGDTVRLGDGRSVRLIGIDSPESTTKRYGHTQCFGVEATEYLKELLPEGSSVRLVADVERMDRFGRTLAYLYRSSDGLFVNLALAENGYAQAFTVPPNVAHAEELAAAAAHARERALGLWGEDCVARR